MIYLASPYSHARPEVMQERYEEASHLVVDAFRRGIIYISPIVYWHELAKTYTLPTDHIPYLKFNMGLLRACTEIHVLTLAGWKTSKGVAQELSVAKASLIPYQYIDETGRPTLILE